MKNILFLFMAFLSFTAFGQDKATLEQEAAKMLTYTKTNQVEKLLDYSHPGIYQYATREQLLELMQNMFKGPGFTITILDLPPDFTFSNIIQLGSNSYALIRYNLGIKMVLDNPIAEDKLQEQLNVFKSEMNTEDVVYDAKAKTLTARSRIESIAQYGPATKNKWVFVNNDGSILIKALIPEEVRKQLGARE